jgi:hypothetical protein
MMLQRFGEGPVDLYEVLVIPVHRHGAPSPPTRHPLRGYPAQCAEERGTCCGARRIPAVIGRSSYQLWRQAAFQPNFCSASRVMWRPMGMEEVAAGEGALSTWMVRSVSPIRKSWTMVPSASTAWARTPER